MLLMIFLILSLLCYIFNVILSFEINGLDYLQEVGRNFIKTTLEDVLVNNDEVCGFGVV